MLGNQTTTPTRKHERPCNTLSASPVETILLSKNRRVDPPNPLNFITKDKNDHFPVIDDLKHGTLCKNKNCKKRTHIKCTKCKIHLCFTTQNNCFYDFHR